MGTTKNHHRPQLAEPARPSMPAQAPPDGGRSERRRWIALAVLCLGQLMMILDSTIVNVALPSIQRDLHFSQGNLTWVMNGYLITFGGLLLLAGRLGDLVGRHVGRWDLLTCPLGADPPEAIRRPRRPGLRLAPRPRNLRALDHAFDYTAGAAQRAAAAPHARVSTARVG